MKDLQEVLTEQLGVTNESIRMMYGGKISNFPASGTEVVAVDVVKAKSLYGFWSEYQHIFHVIATSDIEGYLSEFQYSQEEIAKITALKVGESTDKLEGSLWVRIL